VSPDPERLLPILVRAGAEFIVIGGVAATIHGSARATYDVDLLYSRSERNIQILSDALAPHRPYLREAPPGLPFGWDAKTIHSGLNFTLSTELGDIDLLGEVAAGETYSDLLPHSFEVEAFGVRFKCLDLPTLIRIKEAATKRSRSSRRTASSIGREPEEGNLGARRFYQRDELVRERIGRFLQEHSPHAEHRQGRGSDGQRFVARSNENFDCFVDLGWSGDFFVDKGTGFFPYSASLNGS